MTILDRIVTACQKRLAKKKRIIKEGSFHRSVGPPRPFYNVTSGVTLIAECKKGSPSRGILLEDYDPVSIASQYERGGADAVSVLTEPEFFYGGEGHLTAVRETVSLPVLRKDFIFDTYQVTESWAMGADAILLIAAILSKAQLGDLVNCASELGLDILLEVHNRDELNKALSVPASGIGINARNLKDFSVDIKASKELCKHVPADRIAVAESGIKAANILKEMFNAGFRGFLVGEHFIISGDREGTVREFAKVLKEKG